MDLEQNIDRAFNELIFKIEVLHKFIKTTKKSNTSVGLMELQFINKQTQQAYPGCSQREELLENAIQDAISKLEETKKSFKSKTLKEVRERLIKAVAQ